MCHENRTHATTLDRESATRHHSRGSSEPFGDHMLARLRSFSLLIAVIVAAPVNARAQQLGATPATPAAPAAGPRRDLTATAVRQITSSAANASATLAKQRNVTKPVALMIVGGAAIVLGLLMGEAIGTLFVVGGAVAVLVGLYQ